MRRDSLRPHRRRREMMKGRSFPLPQGSHNDLPSTVEVPATRAGSGLVSGRNEAFAFDQRLFGEQFL